MLIITGSMGSGKSTVLAEASDILADHNIVHAAIDLDGLGVAYLPSKANNDEMMHVNLKSLCENYASIGVTRLLLARAMESRAELGTCRGIVSARSVVVCRLTASLEVMKQRVRTREQGLWQQRFVARVQRLNRILDEARLEDFVVNNEDRSVTEVANELLMRAGWIS